MYSNTGYLNNTDIEIEDREHPLSVSCCGIYRLLQKPVLDIWRPKGRIDYQLLYISSGKAHFSFAKKEEQILTAGHMVLYRPGQLQSYRYYCADRPEICWVHFSGYDAGEMLDKIGFSDRFVLYPGVSGEYTELFRQMIRELQLKRPFFQELLALRLRQMFTMIARSAMEEPREKQPHQEDMERAVQYFNEAFSENICIGDYAKQLHMSACWFIRSFRRYMGMAPMQYITSIRMNKAKELLKSTNYSVQEIGAIVGYDNPLYFSRIFRRQTGVSPVQYRKNGNPAI